tara:strand:- start:19247 stop:20176 length:930 start_codon:yes stop_codon:yes gene_type:complete
MKNKIIIVLIQFIMFFFTTNLASEIDNKIVVKVENEVITSYEIKNKILTTLFLANQEINQSNVNKYKKSAVDQLILNRLKSIELSKYKIKNNDIKTSEYLNSISSNDIGGLIENFKKNGLSFDIYKKEIETHLMWQELIFKLYTDKINIDKSVIDNELNNFLKKQSFIKEFKISEIEIISNNDQSDEIRIKEIQEEISNNGFSNTAIKFSISSSSQNFGDLGWINSKSLSENISKIISTMNIGEISSPIKRNNSILFLKLEDIKKTKTNNLDNDELRKKIINQKKNELYNLYSKSHLSKLRNTSFIEYR